MKVGSKEFYELMDQFEKDILNAPGYVPMNFTKEDKEYNHLGNYYANGEVNTLFYAYLLGYSNAKHLAA